MNEHLNNEQDFNTETRKAYRMLPGLTVRFNVDGAYGPFVDIEADEFARLFAPQDVNAMNKSERLEWALKRAAVASIAYVDYDDGGTCNFDSPALDFAECGMKKAEAERVIRSVGLHCFDWKPFKNHRGDDGKIIKAPTYLVITGFQSG